jgi:glucokinase
MRKLSGKYVGIDVGGTKIAAGLVEAATWRVLKIVKRPTEAAAGRQQVLANILAAITDLAPGKIKGIGLGFAGVIDFQRGRVVMGPNFPPDLADFPLAKEMSKRLKVPVFMDNDVRCFALAEAKIGVAKGKSAVFGLALGTGVGGALIIDGKPYRGKHNAAGEIGHATFAAGSGTECSDGEFGHFEAMASGSAVRHLAAAATGKASRATEIFAAAEAGEPKARAVVEAFRDGLAVGLANIAYLYDPDVIVLGGGIAELEALWRPAVARASKHIIYPGVKDITVRHSKLGYRANIIGAAMLAATH